MLPTIRRKRLATLILTLSLLAPSALRAQDAPATARAAPTAAATGSLTAVLQEALDGLRERHGFPGATAAAVLADGRRAAVATGYSDVEAATPMRPESRLLAGSVGKTFAAATVLALVQAGKLGLDDPIRDHLGEEPWFARLPNGPAITVRHLLRHRGGLADHVYLPEFGEAVAAVEDPDFVFPPRRLIGFVLDREPLFAPGEGFSYTDSGYLLLGLIVEKAGGRAYYEELRDRLLVPLGLERTLPADRRRLPELAAGYLAEENALGLPPKIHDGVELLIHPLNEWTGGGLASSALDLARWAKELYEGRALAEPYLDALFADCRGAGGRCYGLGVQVRDSRLGPTYGHSGWFPGYRTEMAYFADPRAALAVMVNSDDRQDARRYLETLAAAVLDDGDAESSGER